jgi:putative serine protease PepD
MPKQTWMQAAVLSGTVVVSLLVGSFITLSLTDDDDPAAVAPTATTTVAVPVASTSIPSPTTAVNSPTIVGDASLLSADLPDIIAAAAPSVVDIDLMSPDGLDEQGGGSGVVVDTEGRILTNWHVVNAANGPIKVNLYDGTAAIAKFLGGDPANDLAVLEIDVSAAILHPASFGDSEAVRIGEVVFAMGSPFDQDFSVTAGIISAKGRRSGTAVPGLRANPNLLQTDAAINPGNSGGPLFNLDGQVVGINASISTSDGDFDGLGYAIPSNTVVRFLPQLIAGEPIVHPRLGVEAGSIDAVIAERLDLDVSRGVRVVSVDGAAAAAGVQVGDVIVEIDGLDVETFEDLAVAIDANEVGDTIPIVVNRDGDTIVLRATLRAWESN